MGMVLYQLLQVTSGHIKVLPPRTPDEIVARGKRREKQGHLVMALPEDHLAKFYKMTKGFIKAMKVPMSSESSWIHWEQIREIMTTEEGCMELGTRKGAEKGTEGGFYKAL
ncbi:hypothetical protein Tco_0596734 [Tanacetum coccineum]